MRMYCNKCSDYDGQSSRCGCVRSENYGKRVSPYDTCDYVDDRGQHYKRSDRNYGDTICSNCMSFNGSDWCYCNSVWTEADHMCPNFRRR